MFKSLKNAFSKLFTAKKSENRELTELTTDTTTVIANGYRVQAWWLEIAALLLELFAIALVVSWAWHSQSYWLLATICVGAFIGFEIARVYTVPLLVNAVKAKHYGMVVLGFILVFATLLVLFAATVFENVNKADDGVNEKVLNSPAMKALELEIKQTNERISGLAEFSNPNKAHAEMQDLKGKEQTRLAKIEKLKADINGFMSGTPKNKQGESAGNSLTALTNGCKINNWYAQTYCPQVKQKQDELKSLEGNSLTGDASYNKKYDEYNGLQTHLTSLEKRRAELLTSQGEGVINAYKPEDTLIASLFEISAQKASFIKWLVLSAVLDLLGLGLRFLASMARFRASGVPDVNAATREYAKKLKAYATLYGVNGLQDLFDRQTQVIYHDTPALAAPTHGPAARSQQATPPVIANSFAVTAQTTDSQPTMQSNDIGDDSELDDNEIESPAKKQSFIGFVAPSCMPANKPKASDDSQVLAYAENPTNVVIDDSRDTSVVNTNVVYTSVVGDVATCPTCGSTFTRRNKRHKYCCEECRVKGHGFESKSQMMRTMGKAKKTTV